MPSKIKRLVNVLPSVINGAVAIWERFKHLKTRDKVIVATGTPPTLYFMCWLIEKYGIDTIIKAIDLMVLALTQYENAI